MGEQLKGNLNENIEENNIKFNVEFSRPKLTQQQHEQEQQSTYGISQMSPSIIEPYQAAEAEEAAEDSLYDEEVENDFVRQGKAILDKLRQARNVNDTFDENNNSMSIEDNEPATNDGNTIKEKEDLDKELLIETVRSYPILWQPSHPQYKDKTRKKIIWQKISKTYFQQVNGEHFLSIIMHFYFK